MAIKKDPREGNAGKSGRRSGNDRPARRPGKSENAGPKSRPYKDDSSNEKRSYGRGKKKEDGFSKFRKDDRRPSAKSDSTERRPSRSKSYDDNSSDEKKSFGAGRKKEGEYSKFRRDERKPSFGRGAARPPRKDDFKKGPKRPIKVIKKVRKPDDGMIRLNKYIANSGICSRREADELIAAGVIKVNGEVVTELGTKIKPEDKVKYEDQLLRNEKNRYLLLNKPKGYLTTTDDPYSRKTVMALVEGACKERIYPVGRLDRNTTGLLLFTNDGDLAKKLMHPRSRVNKLYHVVLDQALSKSDMMKIAAGFELEDGPVQVDSIAYVTEAKDKKEVGLEIHMGKNRIVRRIFESLGYKVEKLDRVTFANLTKKNLPRGKWRFLDEKEIGMLKML